jgi:hypothetical protein
LSNAVVAELHVLAGLLQYLDCLAVGDSRERALNPLELRQVALERLELFLPPLENALDDVLDERLGELLEPLELEKRDLGLDHPEFHQMSARFRLFCAKRRAEAVDLP